MVVTVSVIADGGWVDGCGGGGSGGCWCRWR